MYASWRVGIVLHALNLTGPGFAQMITGAERAEQRVAKLQNAMNTLRLGASFALAEIGKLGVSGFVHAANSAAQFQTSMVLVAQQTRATVDQMKALQQTAVDLSSGPMRSFFSMNEVVGMARQAQQSGIGLNTLLNRPGGRVDNSLLGQLAYVAEIERQRDKTDPQSTVKSLTSVMRGYGIVDDPAQRYRFLDLYTRVSSQTHMTAKDVQTAETYFGLAARTLHISPDQFLINFGLLKQAGMGSSTAATTLTNMIMNLIPHVSMTSTHTSAAFQALAMLHTLNPADKNSARKIYGAFQKSMKDVNLPVNPSSMTEKQREKFAQMLMAASATSAILSGKGFTATSMAQMAGNARKQYEALLGTTLGDGFWTAQARQALNMRGFRGYLFYGENEAQIKKFIAAVNAQMGLTERAAELRGNLSGQQIALPNIISSIFTELGGVSVGTDKKTGLAKIGSIPGSPLDIMNRVFTATVNFLSKVATWGNHHQAEMAHIGTLVGLLGVGALAGAAALASMAIIGLTRSLWTFSGASGVASALGGVLGGGGEARALLRGRGMGILGLLMGGGVLAAERGAMKTAFLETRFGGLFKKQHRFDATPGGAEGPIGERHTNFFQEKFRNMMKPLRPTTEWAKATFHNPLPEFGEMFSKFFRFVAPVGELIAKLGLRFLALAVPILDIIMVVQLVSDTLKFIFTHGFDIGKIAAVIIHTLQVVMKTIWDIIVNTFMAVVHAIGFLMQRAWHYMTHPQDLKNDMKNFWADVSEGFRAQMWQYMSHDDRAKWYKEHGYKYEGNKFVAPGSSQARLNLNANVNSRNEYTITVNSLDKDAGAKIHSIIDEYEAKRNRRDLHNVLRGDLGFGVPGAPPGAGIGKYNGVGGW